MNNFQRHCPLFKSACWPCPALPCPALPCWRKAFQGSSWGAISWRWRPGTPTLQLLPSKKNIKQHQDQHLHQGSGQICIGVGEPKYGYLTPSPAVLHWSTFSSQFFLVVYFSLLFNTLETFLCWCNLNTFVISIKLGAMSEGLGSVWEKGGWQKGCRAWHH